MLHLNYRELKLVALIPLLFLLTGKPALGLEILSPADGDVLSESTRLVIKTGDKPPIEAITVAVNGEKSDLIDISSAAYRQSFKDFVFLEAEYSPGINSLEVDGYSSGKRVASTKIKAYLPTGSVESPPPFVEKFFHTPESEALCVGCHHNMNPTPKDLASPVPGQNPCSTCHMNIIDGKYVHGPTGVFDCVACHDPDSRPSRYAVPDNDGRFCLDCHDTLTSELRPLPYIHGPVAAGLCLTCHDPHASEAEGLVRGKTLNDSCGPCHQRALESKIHVVQTVIGGGHPLEGRRNPAKPEKSFNCASCHNPHGAKNPRLLRGEGVGFAFCKLCHIK